MLRFMILLINVAFMSANLCAIELNTICNPNQTCNINNPYSSIENSTPFSVTTINIGDVQITNFTNTSTITSTDSQTFRFGASPNNNSRGNIQHFVNRGTISGGIYIYSIHQTLNTITNYGEMRGVWGSMQHITINNQGIIKTNTDSYSGNAAHFIFTAGSLSIENYLVKIIESQSEFNAFTGYTNKVSNKNSHLIVSGGSVGFKDGNSKIVIDFDATNGFELGKAYSIAKLVTNQNGGAISSLSLDFSRLILKNRDFYTLTQSGDNFVVNFIGGGGGNGGGSGGGGGSSGGFVINTEITELRKANLKTMNNLFVSSNAVIYPQKFGAKTTNRATTRITQPANRATTRITQPANRALARTSAQSTKSLITLMPFVSHNLYSKAGNYQLSGLDYGFIGAFSGDSGLGLHLGFSYGNLSDKNDKDFHIKSMNLMAGLNYKLYMIWDMYIKARGDFFYFLNEISSLQLAKVKPDNIGFGANVAFGKDFDMGNAGVLGAEIGMDYKGLSAGSTSAKSTLDNSTMQDYNATTYHLAYVDFGLRYDKYFPNVKLNVGAGVRKNLFPKFAKGKVIVANNEINILLDNDNILGYANAGVSLVVNAAAFSMEFGVAYYGNFGDRSINNSGSLEWRTVF